MIDLVGVHDLSIYLGNKCNFNCEYCDRDYISTKIGDQQMSADDIPKIISFLRSVSVPPLISFHGGEPFVFIKMMDKIMDAITDEVSNSIPFFIQTNGSLISQHEWFFKKWGSRLYISISFDFQYQELNRTKFVIEPAIKMLKQYGIEGIQLQYVMPISDPQVFSFDALKTMVTTYKRLGATSIDLIPLRHLRGGDKFDVIVDKINIGQFALAFLDFIQMLYIKGVNVFVDGHRTGHDKTYFNNHKQMILSPDGYLYPEYDFLEYQWTDTRIGQWKESHQIVQIKPELDLIKSQCVECPSRSECGLKYLYHGFDRPISGNCVTFYQAMKLIVAHTQKLTSRPKLIDWVGI